MINIWTCCSVIFVTVLCLFRKLSLGSDISVVFQSRNALCGNNSVQWVRYPEDCSRYFLCVNGIASPMPKCPWTHVWSNSVKNCVPVESRWDDCNVEQNNTEREPSYITPTAFAPLQKPDSTPNALDDDDDYYYYYYDTPPATDTGDYAYYQNDEGISDADVDDEDTPVWPAEDENVDDRSDWVQDEEPSQNAIFPAGTNWYDIGEYTTQSQGKAWSFVPECGVSASNMIVGGLPSSEGSWPWAVSLRLTWADRHVCGGTLIHPRWIVTAAHCVHGNQFNIPGEWRAVFAEYIDGDSYKTVRNIDLISKHPDFINGGNYPNDIALMRLAEPMDVSGINIRHACLPSRYSDFGPQDSCWIMGWGETKEYANQAILQELQVNVRTLSECAARWGRKRILNSQICVGDGANGACNGDSGGPLVCYRAGYFFVVGVTSWGVSGCQTSGYPSVFTRVSFYENWIDEHISSLR